MNTSQNNTPKAQKKIFEFFRSTPKKHDAHAISTNQEMDASIIDVSSDDDFEAKRISNTKRKKGNLKLKRLKSKSSPKTTPERKKRKTEDKAARRLISISSTITQPIIKKLFNSPPKPCTSSKIMHEIASEFQRKLISPSKAHGMGRMDVSNLSSTLVRDSNIYTNTQCEKENSPPAITTLREEIKENTDFILEKSTHTSITKHTVNVQRNPFSKSFKLTPIDDNKIAAISNDLQNVTKTQQKMVSKDVDDAVKDVIDLDDILDIEWTLSEKSEEFSELPNTINEKTETIDGLDAEMFEKDWKLDNEDTLNLEIWQTCIILEVNVVSDVLVLRVKSETSTAEAVCSLKDTWRQLRLEPKFMVNIRAIRNPCNTSEFFVNNEYGIVVLFPDILLSGTTLMGSLFCRRKSILSAIYGGGGTENKAMFFGFLIHELFQEALKTKLSTEASIAKLANDLLKRLTSINKMYTSQVTTEECLEELLIFVPKIADLIETYIPRDKNKVTFTQRRIKSGNWDGAITNIVDIEENIWCPRLGLKGKIDISIETLPSTISQRNEKERIIPLELKTGRASLSIEHRGQLALYSMMLKELGFDSPAGLLLYPRENVFQEVKVNRREERDLMILRNHIAFYVTRKPKVNFPEVCQKVDTFEYDEPIQISTMSVEPTELPDPISNNRFCGNCEMITICSFTQSSNMQPDVNVNKPMLQIYRDKLKHLSLSHQQYFKQWINAMLLECTHASSSKPPSDIWRLKPEDREKKGRSLRQLIVKGVRMMDGVHETVFVGDENEVKSPRDFRKFGIALGDYMVVSTTNRIVVDAGFVLDITKYSITMSFERNLKDRYSKEVFHLDAYESDHYTMNLSSLVELMEQTEESARLRELIIDKIPPVFSSKVSKKVVELGQEILVNLNQMQQMAIFRTLAAENYLLINGMPGTGKTQTIVGLIDILLKMNQTVLVTSHTNSAVDNVLRKIIEKNNVSENVILRLGSELRCNVTVRHRCEAVLKKNYTTLEELEALYKQTRLVGVTCLGAGHPLIKRTMFDVCIVDESTQVLQPTIIRPLLSARKFVLVGDPEQLPPIVRNVYAQQLGLQESLFDRLYNSKVSENLSLQYRMNNPINTLANNLTYQGKLMCANVDVAESTIKYSKKISYDTEKWLRNICDAELSQAVIFVDTGNTSELNRATYDKCFLMLEGCDGTTTSFDDMNVKNMCELAVVNTIVNTLRTHGIENADIGIISPFRAQVSLLQKVLRGTLHVPETMTCTPESSSEIEVNTVDQFQGRDKRVIIYSCVKTNNSNISGILMDKRRLNVAITRAKNKLIVLGDRKTLSTLSTFESLFKALKAHQFVHLVEGKDDFEWARVVKFLIKQLKYNQ